MFVDLLCTWHTSFYTNLGLKVKLYVLNSQAMKPMKELFNPALENNNP